MVWDSGSASLHRPEAQSESVLAAIEALAKYARAENLLRADELLAEVIALLVTQSEKGSFP